MKRSLGAGVVAGALIAAGLVCVPTLVTTAVASESTPRGTDAVATSDAGAVADPSVTVMLQLDAKPTAKVYGQARSAHTGTAGLAARRQAVTIEHLQSSLEDQVVRVDPAAEVLYTTKVVTAGIAVTTTASHLSELASLPGVRAVRPIVAKTLSNATSVPLTGAPESWGTSMGQGAGIRVGIIDTGIDYTHSDFGGPGTTEAFEAASSANATTGAEPEWPTLQPGWTGTTKVVGGYDFVGNEYDGYNTPHPDANPLDCHGHGTHVAGTVAGFGTNADGSTYMGPWHKGLTFSNMGIGPGMAPRAQLYALKVFGCTGSTGMVAAALDWAADPNGDGNPADHLDVVNLSLGTEFGSPTDPDALALNNIVALGVTAVAAMGNTGDMFEVGGSPGSAVRSIAVASTMDNFARVDGFDLQIGSGAPTLTEGSASIDFDWGSMDPVVGDLVRIGDWTTAPGDGNNIDGCTPLTDQQAADVAGKIVVLSWDPQDSSRRCGSASRTNNVADAGAIGALMASSGTSRGVGIVGNSSIPAMLIFHSDTDLITAAFDATTPMTATFSAAGIGSFTVRQPPSADPTDEVSSFSSRGVGMAGNVKPDVSAPGQEILSAKVGSGTEGTAHSGTSMATPHVAGLAALVLAAHRDWSPEEVKAAIVNYADNPATNGPAHTGDTYNVLRAGSGRINAPATIDANTLMYDADSTGAVAVSFGTVDAASTTTLTRNVRIANKSLVEEARLTLTYEPINALAGVNFSITPNSLTVPPDSSRVVTVSVTIDPALLDHTADPTLDLHQTGDAEVWRQFLTVASGNLLASSVGSATPYVARLPIYVAPRPASRMTAPEAISAVGEGHISTTVALSGTALDHDAAEPLAQHSVVSALMLMGQSPQMPACGADIVSRCTWGYDGAAADIQYAGYATDAQSDPFDVSSTANAYFGISSYGVWRTASDIAIYTVYIDTDSDGAPDLNISNSREPSTDVMVSTAVSMRPGDVDGLGNPLVIDSQPINGIDGRLDTRLIYGDVMVLPVSLAALAHPGDGMAPFVDPSITTSIRWYVISYSGAGTNDVVGLSDANTMEFIMDLVDPGVQVSGPSVNSTTGPVLIHDRPGTQLTVQVNRATSGTDPKILLMHHLNSSGHRAELVSVAVRSESTVSVPQGSSVYGSSGAVTVSVTGSGGTPTGSVRLTEGSRLVGTGTLSSGSTTIRVKGLAAGRHHLTATYSGSETYAASSSRATFTVSKAPTNTSLSLSSQAISTSSHAVAVVSVHAAGSQVGGTIKIKDGATVLKTVALSGGQATIKLPMLSAGSHDIRAIYLESDNWKASGSTRVVVVVKPPRNLVAAVTRA